VLKKIDNIPLDVHKNCIDKDTLAPVKLLYISKKGMSMLYLI